MHATDEVMNMKKFLSGVKKNIFYISLITGMAVLVTVLGLYNAKTNSKEKNIVIGQNTPYGDTSESDMQTKETLSGKDKNAGTEDGTRSDVERDATADSTYAEDSAADLNGGDTDAEITEDDAGQSDVDSENTQEDNEAVSATTGGEETLSYDPKESISWPLTGNVIIPYSMDTTVYFETLKEYKCSPAMVIEAKAGDEVKAVYKCKVAEVSSNSELGNYVKLDLGNGYVVTLGQFEDIKVALGEYLEAGDVVGTIGEPSRFYTKEGTNLYFAIEKDGNPVDPMLLIQ